MRKQSIRHIIAIGAVLLLFLFFGSLHERTQITHDVHFQGDTIRAAISIEGGIFARKGFPVGFNYKLFEKYAENQHCAITIAPPYTDYDYWSMLVNDEVDLLAFETEQGSIPSEYAEMIVESIPINEQIAWAVKKENKALLENINLWLSHYMQQKEFQVLTRQFFRSYKIQKHIDNMTRTNTISPYDDIVKECSAILGWDWRLLAALAYQESRFSMGAVSPKAAVGIMQIKPSTAEHYGINDVFNPSDNIKAGTMHLRYLEKRFSGLGMDSANVVKFTLAAYNAGEGRIDECIDYATLQGKDGHDWEEVCRTIPTMQNGFKGNETIEYVDAVLSKYEEFKFVVK